MNSLIFVAVLCMGGKCEFIASNTPIKENECAHVKQQFLALPFKPEVTLAAAQCMPFNDSKVRV